VASPPDPNADLLAQFKATAAIGGPTSQADLLAQRNAEPEPDPLRDVDYTGDLATDAATELDALAIGFRERTKREDERFRLATDSEFWFVLCFRSRTRRTPSSRPPGSCTSGTSTSTAARLPPRWA
jgi:hypothetical protein